MKALLRNVSRLVRADQLVECFVDRNDISALDERACDVRPPDRASRSKLVHATRIDLIAQGAKALDHAAASRLARLPESRETALDALIMRIEGVGEDVHVHTLVLARQLDAGDQSDAALVGVRLDLEIRRDVVVIADGDDVEAVLAREIDDLARRARSIRMVGVKMKVRELL